MKKIQEDNLVSTELSQEDLDLIKQVEELLDKDLINKEKEVDEDAGMTSSVVLGINSTENGFMDGKTNFVMPKKLKHIDSDEEVKILKRFELQENFKKKKSSKKTVVAPPYWFPIDNTENNSESDIGDIAVDAGIAVGESDEEDDESFE